MTVAKQQSKVTIPNLHNNINAKGRNSAITLKFLTPVPNSYCNNDDDDDTPNS